MGMVTLLLLPLIPAEAGNQLLRKNVAGLGPRFRGDERRGDASHRVPREDVAGAIERRQRGTEGALELLIERLRRPAVGAVQRADRARLIEQEDLVVAHREDLPRNALGSIGGEIDDHPRHLLRRHFLETLDAPLLLLPLTRNRTRPAG